MDFKVVLIFALFTCASCTVLRKTSIPLNDVIDIQCIGNEMDGSVTLIAFGSGSNKRDAINKAKKTLYIRLFLEVLIIKITHA